VSRVRGPRTRLTARHAGLEKIFWPGPVPKIPAEQGF